jgi:hypothetical protein
VGPFIGYSTRESRELYWPRLIEGHKIYSNIENKIDPVCGLSGSSDISVTKDRARKNAEAEAAPRIVLVIKKIYYKRINFSILQGMPSKVKAQCWEDSASK